jgi:Holliday junction resolvasome RuvABC endonuclease subunit
MISITAVGIDAAFANMGFAKVEINLQGGQTTVVCRDLILVSTEVIEDRKAVRKSSTELRRAKELHEAIQTHCSDVQFAFVEVPSGSQSASAARALGIAVGVLASCPVPIIEVSPMEVKFAVIPNKKIKVSKDYIIQWAVKKWPQAPWLLSRGANKGAIVKANEHLADALATVMAGIATPEFQRLIALNAIPGLPVGRRRII